jgi:hypothetical protein
MPPRLRGGVVTEAHLSALRALALQDCQEPVELFEARLRRTAKLPAQASVSPRLLVKTLPMSAYMEIFAYYTTLKGQLARKSPEGTHGAVQASPHASVPEPAVSASVEGTPAVPSAVESSSAASDLGAEAKARDEARLREEISDISTRLNLVA